jgi:hypothetical protein
MVKKKNHFNEPDEIESLNERVLNAQELSAEELERVAGGNPDFCNGFSGSCPTFYGTCIRYSTQFAEE